MSGRLVLIVATVGIVATITSCTSGGLQPHCPYRDDNTSSAYELPLPESSGQNIPVCPEDGSDAAASAVKEHSLTLNTMQTRDILMIGGGIELLLDSGAQVSQDIMLCGGGPRLTINHGALFSGSALLNGGGAMLVLKGGTFTGRVVLQGGGTQVVIVDPPTAEEMRLPGEITVLGPPAQAVGCYDKNPPDPNMDPCGCYL